MPNPDLPGGMFSGFLIISPPDSILLNNSEYNINSDYCIFTRCSSTIPYLARKLIAKSSLIAKYFGLFYPFVPFCAQTRDRNYFAGANE